MVGDELALAELLFVTDDEVMPEFTRVLSAGKSAAEAQVAVQTAFAALASGLFIHNHLMHCGAARLFATRLGMGTRVVDGLAHVYERWDGRSTQQLAQGDGTSLPMRVVQVALLAAYDSTSRTAADIGARARVRAGNQLDPKIAVLLTADPVHFLEGLDAADLTQALLDAEPGGPVWLIGAEIDTALSAIADFGDFKSPHMLGHSRRVSAVASAAARQQAWPLWTSPTLAARG